MMETASKRHAQPAKAICLDPKCQSPECRLDHELQDGRLRWCERCGGYLPPQSDLTPIHARCTCPQHLPGCSEESGCDFGCPLSEPRFEEETTGMQA
jgi:hypothetical protein